MLLYEATAAIVIRTTRDVAQGIHSGRIRRPSFTPLSQKAAIELHSLVRTLTRYDDNRELDLSDQLATHRPALRSLTPTTTAHHAPGYAARGRLRSRPISGENHLPLHQTPPRNRTREQ